MESQSIDREWKKGSAELLILSLLEAMPRHGYEISKLIEQRSRGALRFHAASLYRSTRKLLNVSHAAKRIRNQQTDRATIARRPPFSRCVALPIVVSTGET